MSTTPAASDKPRDWAEFIAWMRTHENQTVRDDLATKRHFDMQQAALQNELQKHAFFSKLPESVREAERAYLEKTANPLILEGSLAAFTLLTKSYASALDKAYRLNVAWNNRWPKPPKTGWVLPSTWYTIFDDLLRATLVCKYIDGPEPTCAAMQQLATVLGLSSEFVSRQLDEGYYAYHFYIVFPVEVSAMDFTPMSAQLKVEIQVTTQLQESARRLTHEAYADQRSRLDRDRDAWKWEHASDRFRAGYIAHTLHLIEGLIVELRDRKRTPPANPVAAGKGNSDV